MLGTLAGDRAAYSYLPASVRRFPGPERLAAMVAAAGVGVAAYSLRNRAAAHSDEALRDSLVLLVPIALVASGAIVGAGLVRMAFLGLSRRFDPVKAPLFLALKRLAGTAGMTQVLVTTSAVALGVMVYGATASSSVEATARAKAGVFVGGDVAAPVPPGFQAPGLPFPHTTVLRVARALLEGGVEADLLGIDPDSFARVAYWEDDFGDRPLAALVAALSKEGSPPHAIVAGANLPGGATLSTAKGTVALETVAHVDAFPGLSSSGLPLVVMTDADLERTLAVIGESAASEELWSRGDADRIEEVLRARGVTLGSTVSIDGVLDTPGLQPLLSVLGLLGAIGGASAAIAVAGLLLHLQARNRAAVLSSALTRRMGLPRAAELVAWSLEIAGAAVAAFVLAVAAGVPVAQMMNRRLDLRPTLVPDPVLVPPYPVIVVTGAILVAVVAVAAWMVQRGVDRANIAEVLRAQ
jgi:putative ABC transport system permease protein